MVRDGKPTGPSLPTPGAFRAPVASRDGGSIAFVRGGDNAPETVVVSRSDGTVRSWSVPPMMAFHAVQAYEDGDDIVLELCTAEPAVFDALYLDRVRAGRPVDVPHRVMRYRLQAGRGEAMPQPLMVSTCRWCTAPSGRGGPRATRGRRGSTPRIAHPCSIGP